MKKKHITIILLTAFIGMASGQTFEGKITYQVNYKSKHPNVQDQQFNSMMGTIQEYIIKGGDYKYSFNGAVMQWQLYNSKENRLYNKMSNSESVQWNDAGNNPDKVISVVVNKGVTEILGYKCDELIMTCKSGIQKYYFNEKIAVDISLFKNHTYGNWYEYLKVAKALPLKSIIDTPQFVVESVATEITAMEIDDKEFQLPKNAKPAKSPYATKEKLK